jgi:Zn-dependent protease with chaperone function
MAKKKGPSKKVPAKRSRGKKTLPALSPHAFEHPLDKAALRALERVPSIDWVIRKFITAIGERRLRLFFLASAVRVGDEQLPRVKKLYDEACRVLDVQEPPELFIAQRFFVNAAAIGVDKPFIVVTSALVDMLDDDELQCVLAHELGHVMCGHALYTTLLMLLINMWFFFLGIPGGIYAMIALRAALLEWSRKAELSADRAGLLVSQAPEVSYRVDMKLAGGRLAKEMSIDAFHAQADEYESAGDLLDGVLKLALLVEQSHPFPVLRVAELKRWVESGQYEEILAGQYEERGSEPETSWVDSIKATAGSYKDSFDNSDDHFVSAVRDLAGGAAATGVELFELIKRRVGKQPPREPEDPDLE